MSHELKKGYFTPTFLKRYNVYITKLFIIQIFCSLFGVFILKIVSSKMFSFSNKVNTYKNGFRHAVLKFQYIISFCFKYGWNFIK